MKQEFKKPLTHEQFVKLAKDKGYKSKEEASKSLGYRWDSENWIDDKIKPFSKRPKYAGGGGIEVVGKGNKGAFRKREYDGMSEKEVILFWENRGYKISKTKSEGKLKPYTFYINKFAKGGGVEKTQEEKRKTEKEALEDLKKNYENTKYSKGGKVGKSKGDIGKSGTQYGYTLKEWEQMAKKRGLLVSPREWWKSQEGKPYTDSFGRKKKIGQHSGDKQHSMGMYGYLIANGLDLGSKIIPTSAKKYVEENNYAKYAKGGEVSKLIDKIIQKLKDKGYSNGDNLKLTETFNGKKVNLNFYFETAGDWDNDIDAAILQIEIISKYLDFDRVDGLYENSIIDWKLYKGDNLVCSMNGYWDGDEEPTVIKIGDIESVLNFYPFGSLGGLDTDQFEKNLKNALNEIKQKNLYSAVVSLEGYEQYSETVDGLENAKKAIQDIKENTRFQVVKGDVAEGDLIKQDDVIETYAKGGGVRVGNLKGYLIHKEKGVEYYKNFDLIHPTKEEKLKWEIYGLPNDIEKIEQSFETTIDVVFGKTKKEIQNKLDYNIENGKYNYLGTNPDLYLSFDKIMADGGRVGKRKVYIGEVLGTYFVYFLERKKGQHYSAGQFNKFEWSLNKVKKWIKDEGYELVENPNKNESGGDIEGITLTTEQVETKLGRKLHWWNDDVVSINGVEYKKVFLKSEYKRLYALGIKE